MMKNNYENYNDGYYHIGKDVEDYKDAWCIVVWSRRGPGKTYSCLWNSYWNKRKIIYMKRTKGDVDFICSHNDVDTSPYYPINRDKGTNIIMKSIGKGMGASYDTDEEGNADGAPISYVFSLNGVKTIKGFDLSICDWMVMDEFIPQMGEIVRHAEGSMLLDVYMTANRDREKRGLPPIKLILFANAENISTPITNELGIMDDMAELQHSGKTHKYIEGRGILLHHITDDEIPIKEEEKQGIFKGMRGTTWFDKSFGGDFSNNDFTCVKTMSIKKMKPFIHLHTKTNDYFIYINKNGLYYMCNCKQDCTFDYDLTRESEQKKFFIEHCMDLRDECVYDNMRFQKYSMYDMIMNFNKKYNV